LDKIQIIQNRHRQALIDYWKIAESSRVLEIGCGQGDTTALLAEKVGKSGFVYAIDPASESYGSPMTLGQARSKLLNSEAGKQLMIDLDTDIFSFVFPENESIFDYVILSHSSWYFSSSDLLYQTFRKVRKYARQLCFAEWDIRLNSMNQLAHYQSVMIQAQFNSMEDIPESNIRTLFTPYDIINIATKAGWDIIKDAVVDSTYLQDGRWEVNYVLEEYFHVVQSTKKISQKMKDLLLSQIKLLNKMDKNSIESLNTFAFVAK